LNSGPSPPNDDITTLLERWNSGDRSAFEELVPIVYNELRSAAAGRLRREPGGGTLGPTALVHEVYLQLAEQRRVQYHNRAHFFGAAAGILRRILVDRARQRHSIKHGGDYERVPFDESLRLESSADVDLVDLDAALSELEQLDPQKTRIVELRYFAGFSIPETAEVMGISATTVKREWSIARAWLYDRLSGGQKAGYA
jgi:RNA polymerase sigma-70 factor (ECF subfamily)